MIRKNSVRLLPFILICFVLAGCSDTTLIESNGSDLSEIEVSHNQPLQASFMDSRLDEMKGMVENEQLQLFVDEATGNIAVHNKDSGEIWYSNPPDREQDSIASGVNSDLLSSQIQLHFYNNFGQGSVINSYSDSIVHEQYQIEEIPDGVRVLYQFGKAERSAADLPLMLSQERFEELSSQLDNTGQRALMIAYTENSSTGIYERNDSALNGMQLERAFTAFEEAGYTDEDLQQDMAELNFTQENESGRVFLAAIEYTLDEDSLLVRVPVSSIQYSPDYPVSRVSMMRFFGAQGTEETGSIFVPDGSGALINFNNGKTKYSAYQQSVYGTDMSTLTRDEDREEETVRLPVFGLIKDDGDAVLGIIEEGASVATISADVSGRVNNYNYVFPTFTVISKGDVTLQANQQERTLPRFQEDPMNTDFSVRYVFLTGEEASYQGMARYYQDYLVNQNQLTAINEDNQHDDLPFYLELVGNISKRQHMVGIPYEALEPLTTFEQATSIMSQMKENEIENIKLSYSGWFNSGVNHKLPNSIKVDRGIGGKQGFEKLLQYTQEHNIAFYPEMALLNVHSDSGFSERKQAARTLTDIPATVYPLNLALNARDRTQKPSYVLSPSLVESYTEEMLADFLKLEATGISLRDLADTLNSDFRRNEQVDRVDSERISINALNSIYEEDLDLLAVGGNSYAFPYLSDIVNMPMDSSGFKLQDESIPFFQMVVRGFIEYTGTPYNLSTNLSDKAYVLKALEYGANVHFKWTFEDNESLKDTRFNHLYAVNYEQWLEKGTELYHQVNDVLKQVAYEPITAHQKLEENVYQTEYSNGLYVMVNYNDFAVTIDGKTIEAESYITGGGVQ
ncbi:DUF5696 domain-containing protein [Alkalihalobacillus trypoxylicola]|uniref:Uncharacterized protein n=1 Tax=Alkalihalobacillus trypoxylicola TaxID=519424 RepID=A0A161PF05_9BACI|nr:DUF5696 domain-containing protein [Alkalihalobacillus trypoxylicola]KYG26970.1 hypothetical protein AZF04_11565 [Alkalihalobacillus trypoxylicola]